MMDASGIPLASGQITDLAGFFDLNGKLADLVGAQHFNDYVSAQMVSPHGWPSSAPGLIGWKLSGNILSNSWHQSEAVIIGPLGAAEVAAVASQSNPISWTIYLQPPGPVDTAPTTGNLALDLATGEFKGTGDTASAAGNAVADAVAPQLAKIPWGPIAIGAGLLLLILKEL